MSEYMIMLNSACNLKCKYCFAAESMCASEGDISQENFDAAVRFALVGVEKRGIGIIGGEPTLHANFDGLMLRLFENDRVESVDVFTNGTTIVNHIPVLLNSKMHILVNCNSPLMIGKPAYQRIIQGLDALFENGIPLTRIGLGVNITVENTDFSYFLSLVDRYNMDSVRISVAVPSISEAISSGRFRFFSKFVEQAHNLVIALLDRGTIPIFDCNKIPPCLLTGKEDELFSRYHHDKRAIQALSRSNYLNRRAHCTPSIVVDQNLNAVRCFALSAQTRCSINDSATLSDLQEYYTIQVDSKGYQSDCSSCDNCSYRLDRLCMGGCLIFNKHICN